MISINRLKDKSDYNVFRIPIYTDMIFPFISYHPNEKNNVALRYLTNVLNAS